MVRTIGASATIVLTLGHTVELNIGRAVDVVSCRSATEDEIIRGNFGLGDVPHFHSAYSSAEEEK